MDEFVAIAFGAPTVGWTVALLVALAYWVTVIVGALDVKVLGGGDADVGDAGHGHDHGADGHDHGADGHDHSHDADGGEDAGDSTGAKEGVLSALMSALKLRSVPLTVSLSLVFLFGWIVSYQASYWLAPRVPGSPLLAQSLVTMLSLVLSVLAASVAVRPLAPFFRVRTGPRHADLIGKTVRITTGRVDGRFGEGELDDRGAGLRLQVRCEDEAALARGDEALILGWDAKSEAFEVEAMHRVDGTSANRRDRRGRAD